MTSRRKWTGKAAKSDAPPEQTPTEDLIPVRILNEYAFCPHPVHLMHVEGRWEDNE